MCLFKNCNFDFMQHCLISFANTFIVFAFTYPWSLTIYGHLEIWIFLIPLASHLFVQLRWDLHQISYNVFQKTVIKFYYFYPEFSFWRQIWTSEVMFDAFCFRLWPNTRSIAGFHVTQGSLIITQVKNKIAYHLINWGKKLKYRRGVINKQRAKVSGMCDIPNSSYSVKGITENYSV